MIYAIDERFSVAYNEIRRILTSALYTISPERPLMKSATHEISLTDGNLFFKLLRVSIPLILSTLLQLLYNAADLVVCGQFGSSHSVAAISATNPLINLYIQLLIGLSVGANVLMARCYGAKDRERGQKVVYTSMVFALVSGILIGVIGATTSRFFLVIMQTPAEIIDLSTSYLVIYFCGLPFSMIYNFGSSVMRATGDTKRPFYFLGAAGLVNVLLNLFFVIVCRMDVAGVALATIISQGISALCVVIAMLRNRGFFRFRFREVRFHGSVAKEIAVIGIPAGVQGMLFSISNVMLQSSINGFGTSVMDGNGAAASLEGFVYATMNSVAQTAGSFAAANYGAKKWKNARNSALYAALLVMLFWSVSAGIIYFFRYPLLGLYLNAEDTAAFAAAGERMLAVCCTYFLCGLMDTFAYTLRGIGHSFLSMSVCLAGVCGLRIVWIYLLFPTPAFHSMYSLMFSYPVSWIITGVIETVLFFAMLKKEQKKSQSEGIAA